MIGAVGGTDDGRFAYGSAPAFGRTVRSFGPGLFPPAKAGGFYRASRARLKVYVGWECGSHPSFREGWGTPSGGWL